MLKLLLIYINVLYIIIVFFMSLSITRKKFLKISNKVIENRIVNKYNYYIFNKNVLINVFKIIIVACDLYKIV